MQKTKAGIRVGKLREHSHSKVADAAKACVLIWKAVAAKDGLTGRSVGSINSSGASSAVQVSNGSSSLSQPSPSPTAAADSPALQSDAASARSGAAPVARLAAARQRPLDALCKCVAETMTKHFGSEDGQTDLAVLGLPVPTPEQIKEQADSQGKVLEAAIFSKHGGSSSDSPSAGYTEQVKLLALNLRRNVAICTQFFFGMYSAEALAKITAEEIASSAAKAAMEQALKDGAEAVQVRCLRATFQYVLLLSITSLTKMIVPCLRVQLDWKSKNKSAMLASAGECRFGCGCYTAPTPIPTRTHASCVTIWMPPHS